MHEDLLHRHLLDQTTDEEERALSAWREESEANEAAYRRAVDDWHALADTNEFDVEKGWRALSERLDAGAEVVPFRRRGSYFAALAAAVLIAALMWMVMPDAEPIAFEGSAGEQRLVSLPDGTRVHLYGTSTLRHDSSFGARERTVRLEGQAFFEVRRSDQPFVVTTAQARVRVLGTEFDVREGNDQTRVVVREGRVRVEDGRNGVELGPDEMTIVRSGEDLSARPVEGEPYFTWLDGELCFEGAPLADVLLDLERNYGVRMTLEDPDVAATKYTATYKSNTDLVDVLEEISLAVDLSYEETGEGYRFFTR